MRKIFMIFGFTTMLASWGFTQQIPNPIIWLKADQKGSVDSIWLDASGNNNIAHCQGFSPDTILMNYNPTVLNNLDVPPFFVNIEMSELQQMTVIIVYHNSDSVEEHGLWSAIKDSNISINLSNHRITTKNFKIDYTDTTFLTPSINTLSSSWDYAKIDSIPDRFVFAGNDSLPFNGSVSELFVFDKLESDQLHVIQSYLAIKYGISLFRLNYLSTSREILWNSEVNNTYAYNITGIGCDTLIGLHQKQSHSSEGDLVTIGVKTITNSNLTNNSVLPHGNYLIWGNNGGDCRINWIDSSSTVGFLTRKWLCQISGENMDSLETMLSVKLPIEDSVYDNFWLIIGRTPDSTGNYSSFEYYLPDSISPDGEAYFNTILWDIDGSGSDMFTFYFLKNQQSAAILPSNNSSQMITNAFSDVIEVPQIPNNNGMLQPNEQNINLGNSDKYKVFPNPSSGIITAEVNLDKEQTLDIIVTDCQGRVVYNNQYSKSTDFKISIEIIKQGTYMLEIRTVDECRTFPVIIK